MGGGPKHSAALDELEAIARRLDELRADLTKAAGPPLPQDFADVWSSSTALTCGAVRFLKTFAGGLDDPRPASDAILESAGPKRQCSWADSLEAATEELRGGALRLEGARLRAHMALADQGDRWFGGEGCGLPSDEEDETDPDGEPAALGDGLEPLRAHCPRCCAMYEWAPTYYRGAARSVAGEWLREQRRGRQRHDEELRREVAEERRRLRLFVEEELEQVFALGDSGGAVSSAADRPRPEAPRQGEPQQVLDALRRRSEALRRQRRRLTASEQLAALRRRAVDEVMEVVDEHLEDVWSTSVASWLEAVPASAGDALSAVMAAAAMATAGSPGAVRPEEWQRSPPVASRWRPESLPATPEKQQLAATPARSRARTPVYSLDAHDAPQEAFEAQLAGREVIHHYEMLGRGLQSPLSSSTFRLCSSTLGWRCL